MKRSLALLLIVTLVMPACATRRPAMALARSSQAPPATKAPSPSAVSPALWRQFAEKLPAGAGVHVRTASGERITGVILAIDDLGLVVNPKTRVPEPARRIAFDTIAQLELAGTGSNLAKAAAIGAGVGAGAFFGLLLLTLAAFGDS